MTTPILSHEFLSKYNGRPVKWGFPSGPNHLGELVYRRTYRRGNETWKDTVARVVNGTFELLEKHCRENDRPWDAGRMVAAAEDMYERIFSFKFTPPGRGLWLMGTDFVRQKGAAGLNNCGFTSTKSISTELARPFEFLMDMSMLGVGIGFDTRGAGTCGWHPSEEAADVWAITDDREGWVESTARIIRWGLGHGKRPQFDYSLIRDAGLPINGFGGVASGPGPLKILHQQLFDLVGRRKGELVSSRDIADIGNMIGACVISGNVRRCLPIGTLVHTDQGLIRIEDIKPGMMAKTSTGYARISELVAQGRQELVAVNTQLGSFRCTARHQMAVITSPGRYEWKRAEQLVAGDRLVFVDGGLDGTTTSMPSWSYDRPRHSTTCQDITPPKLDTDSAWFLGLLHGNGYVYPNFEGNGFNAHVVVACSPDYPSIVTRCQKEIKRYGVNLCDSLPTEKDKSYKVRAQSKQLAWYLSKFKTAKQPIDVPDIVLQGTRETRAAYVAGLFDSDGTANDRPLVIATSVYPTYLKQVQAVCASLGIPTRIKSRRKPQGNWQELFALTCVGERAVDKFRDVVATYSEKWAYRVEDPRRSGNDFGYPAAMVDVSYGRKWCPNNRQMTVATYERCGGDAKGLIPVEVFSVESTGEQEETFDISVPDAKEFVCQEGLLVHNTAEIIFGDPNDQEYLDLKNYEKNPERGAWGWTSNNSVFATVGMDYTACAERSRVNGEPGYFWLENARAYGRMCDPPNWLDANAEGANPCAEQVLFDKELCCLVETFPHFHTSLDEYKATLESAFLYAKAVTLAMTHWEETNVIIRDNRRIGTSMSGVVEFLHARGEPEFIRWCNVGYGHVCDVDRALSKWLCVNESLKKTSVKPAGTVALVAGSKPGAHYDIYSYYLRRIRFAKGHPDLSKIVAANYYAEPAIVGYEDYPENTRPVYDHNTMVVEFPVDGSADGLPTQNEVPLERKFEIAVLLQVYWADNSVSYTASFLPEEGFKLAGLLEKHQRQLKGMSVLPVGEVQAFPQMPYERITKEEYERRIVGLKPIMWAEDDSHAETEAYCEGGLCSITPEKAS